MTQKEAARKKLLVSIGAGITVACPPLGVLLGLAGFLNDARKYAQSGKHEDATDMVFNCGSPTQGTKR